MKKPKISVTTGSIILGAICFIALVLLLSDCAGFAIESGRAIFGR